MAEPETTAPRTPEVSRRDVFRWSAGVAAFAAGMAAPAAANLAQASPGGGTGGQWTRFRVYLDKQFLPGVSAVEIGGIQSRVTAPGVPPEIMYLGLEPVVQITLHAADGAEPALTQWYEAVKGGGSSTLRELRVEIHRRGGGPSLRTLVASAATIERFEPGAIDRRLEDEGHAYVIRCPLGSGLFTVGNS